MEFDVFISHSSKDKTMADAVCAELEQAGIRCWIAPRDIMPGMTWSGEIMKAIERCKVMVLVFSSNANESVQIIREVESAVHRGKPILPLRIEDIQPSDSMAFFMNSVHWLDAISEPHERYLDQLVQAVASLLGLHVAAKAPPQKPEVVKQAAPAFDWKPVAYTALAVVVLAGLWPIFSRTKTPASPGISMSGPTPPVYSPPVTPGISAAPAVPVPAPAPVPASLPAPVPPSRQMGSIDAVMTGTWYLKAHLFDYDGTSTLTYGPSGTYSMATALADSGTYQSGAGQWTTTSNGTGVVRQGTYQYAGSHWIKVTGPLGAATWSRSQP